MITRLALPCSLLIMTLLIGATAGGRSVDNHAVSLHVEQYQAALMIRELAQAQHLLAGPLAETQPGLVLPLADERGQALTVIISQMGNGSQVVVHGERSDIAEHLSHLRQAISRL